MPQMIDTATKVTPPVMAQLPSHGVEYLWKYFNRFGPHQSKCWDRAEAQDATGNGIRCMVTYEDFGATPSSFTEANGYAAAKFSREFGHSELNLPPTTGIYYAVDFDATRSQIMNLVIPYFRGVQRANSEARDIPTLVPAVYGSGSVITALLDANLLRNHWVSGSMGFSGTRAFLATDKWQIRQGPKMEYNIIPGLNVDEGSLRPGLDPETIGYFTVGGGVPQPVHPPTIRKGSHGPDVVKLQTLLHVTADGDFGPITEAAVKVFQTSHGLVADGVVGDRTWTKLLSTTGEL